MAVEAQSMGLGPDNQAPPMKFSRYRSVRRAASQKQEPLKTAIPAVPIPPVPSNPTSPISANSQGTTVVRSVSRYRRQRNPAPSPAAQHPVSVPTPSFHAPGKSDRPSCGPPKDLKAVERANISSKGEEDDVARTRHRQDAMSRLVGGDSRPTSKQTLESRTDTSNYHKPIDDNNNNRATSSNGQQSGKETKLRSLKDTMKLFRSKVDVEKEGASAKPTEPSGTTFPGVDAPVSAVNAGERHVLVQYRKATNFLPITTSTTAQDLLLSAQSCFDVDAQTFVLIEHFAQFGLERPLRKYEYVRDVMNSWTKDTDNKLIIVPAASLDALHQLEAQSAPIEQPADTTFHIYHSQRSRKWDKRYMTLRSDGQVTVSKKYQGQDQTNICHLSDFDIYSPTLSSLSNDVKPPKKICYAVKSQQKASMFLSTENYVQFFSTSDKEVAEGWYKAIQAWRSWYLVSVLGTGQNKDEASLPEISRQQSDESPGSKTYQPKPLKPLLEFEPLDQQCDDEQPSSPERMKSSKANQFLSRRRSTKSSQEKPLTVITDVGANSQGIEQSPFSPTGLLGHNYIMRQRAMQEREEIDRKAYEEVFSPQGLVSGAGAAGRRQYPATQSQPSSRSNTMTSTQGPDASGLVQRSQSVSKGNHRPLVDLTPVYQEPPQHARKGRGVAVDPGTPLVDAATTPDLLRGAIVVPSATTWKRPPIPEEPTSTTNVKTCSRSNTVRSARNTRPRASSTTPSDDTFIPNSLLARSATQKATNGGPKLGHGVATGDRNATKPMLDMSPGNPFVEGSLLRDL
ncbi:hypothetical protein SI65_04290 [Aspergillus cristatus]|uniref:PH domain-containing protein n=1 Tax=Aspergillus cristatus TaxID=573508 RepID=A0A1E3BK04_ASPCR|nr:hypothetical protein SI65_04290 [Aspergillus cristatus]